MAAIGEKLKKTREEKGLSLGDVYSATKIQEDILKKLEQDSFDSLPNPIYIKSFLRKYAQFLGLDSEEIIQQFLSPELQSAHQELVIEEEKLPPFKPEQIRSFVMGAIAGAIVLGIILFFMR